MVFIFQILSLPIKKHKIMMGNNQKQPRERGESLYLPLRKNPKKTCSNSMKIQELIETIDEKFDEVSHMLITDYPKGDYMDGYIAALGWILGLIE